MENGGIILTGENRITTRKPSKMPVCPQQMSRKPAWDRTVL